MGSPILDPRDLKERIQAIVPEIVELRHRLHRIPEPKLEEKKTARLIREEIKSTSLKILPPYLETDTVGLLEGGQPGENITLRADIDALPIKEESGVAWVSEHPGCAHSCGHDGHTAILIGTLRVLDGLTDRFRGSIRFVFQPAEEELGGGRQMIEKGLLSTEPLPQRVFALHGWPDLPVGTAAAGVGAVMAAADRFTITVTGVGGHGARPHVAVDPILTSAQIVSGLQEIVSRNIDPVKPAVVSVCMIHGGDTNNVIPAEVVLEGTTRYFDSALQEMIRSRMEQVIAGICSANNAGYQFSYRPGYIPLVNDGEQVAFVQSVVETYMGPETWAGEIPLTMGAEDFSYYLDRVPGAFVRLGLGSETANLHSSKFDFNDKAIATGITLLTAVALEALAADTRTPKQ